MLQALLAAAPSIISGIGSLFGGGGETTSSTINYAKLRRAAEKGGFNPLTALRAGGGAGFVQTHSPAFASAQTLANAVASGFEAAFNTDPVAAETAELERDLLKAQLKAINDGVMKPSKFSAPAVGVPTPGRHLTRTGTDTIPSVTVPAKTFDGREIDASNPDMPMEAETDLWRWARENRIVPKVKEIWEGNRPDFADAFNQWMTQSSQDISEFMTGRPAPTPSNPWYTPPNWWLGERAGGW